MIGADVYPITLAEMQAYSADADRLFENDEHEKLKYFLAVHPELGTAVAGTDGVRQMRWPTPPSKPRVQVFYFFHDLNMPVYLLAANGPGEWVRESELDEEFRGQLRSLVRELLAEHPSKDWNRPTARLEPSA